MRGCSGTQQVSRLCAFGARLQLEVELAAMPSAGPRAPTGRLREAFLAVRRECDELAVQLAQIEAYQPDVVKTGKTPVLDSKEWRKLLDSIPTTTVRDLRDRALIATLTYSFAQITAALTMKVEDLVPRPECR